MTTHPCVIYDVKVNKLGALIAIVMLAAPQLALAQDWDRDQEDWWNRWYRNELSYSNLIQALGENAVVTFPIPVLLGVEVNQLSPNFGDPRGGGTRSHEGLDIMAPAGTPIVSPTDAVVIRIDDGSDSGLYVRTANPGGEQFVYMHMKEVAKGITEGVAVKRGDVLGFVGNTGNASGGAPHLHFEVRKNGATDPLPRLTLAFNLTERMTSVQQALEKTTDANLAATLANNFKSTFNAAKAQGISIAQSIVSNMGGTIVGVNTVSADPVAAPVANPVPGFVRDLELGMKGEDVRTLQKFLNGKGYIIAATDAGSPGNETTYFGGLTKLALSKYQAANGISPAAGYYGPKTRAYVASHQ